MFKLIIGLGNPGKQYEQTRHNLGFMVADYFLTKKHGKYTEEKPKYLLGTLRIKSQRIMVAKPLTFMNLSGKAVKSMTGRHELTCKDLLVVCDDFALPFGKLRLRRQGSDGGHNGLGSIIEELGTEGFARLRLGVGLLPQGEQAEKFVLASFTKEELDGLEDFVKLGASCIETAIYRGFDIAMEKFNGL